MVTTQRPARLFQAWFGPWVGTSAIHAVYIAVLILLVDFFAVLNVCIVIEANFYFVGLELVETLWRRKAQIGAMSQQFVKMAAPSLVYFHQFRNYAYKCISSIALLCMYTVSNSAQDFKRSFEQSRTWII